MTLPVVDIDEDQLRHFEEASGQSHLLQSFAWKEVQEGLGRATRFVGVKVGIAPRLVALVTQLPLPLGRSQLYIPRGPLIAANKLTLAETSEAIQTFFDVLREWAAESKAIFARFDPALAKHFHHYFTQFGAIDAPHDMSPRRTVILDLTQPAAALLAATKPKTRYNIRLAQKKGVSVRISDRHEDLSKVLDVLHETAKRDGFSLHDDHYYRKQLDILGPRGNLKIFIAEAEGRIVAANLVSIYHNQMIYLHGGSRHEARDLMAPYALHWAAIEYGQSIGATSYDLWGIAADDDPNHPWAGITRFKRGFGGREETYVGTLDLPFDSFWYSTYTMSKKWKL